MANPLKGEVPFDLDGTSYTLLFSCNAICELEAELDKGIVEIGNLLADPTKLRMAHVRALIWAGLRERHSEISIKEAGDLVIRLGLMQATELIARALTAAFPEAESDSRPPEASRERGTGSPS